MLLKTTARCASIAQVDAALVRFKNRIQFAELVPELRLCMAASKCTQRNKRANRTKRLGIKQFLRVAQTERACAANIGATFPFCRPISLKELGKVLAKTGRCVSWLNEVSRICEYFGGTGRLLPSRNALSCICGVTKVPAQGSSKRREQWLPPSRFVSIRTMSCRSGTIGASYRCNRSASYRCDRSNVAAAACIGHGGHATPQEASPQLRFERGFSILPLRARHCCSSRRS